MLLASGGSDHKVRLWDPVSGQARGVLDGHAKTVRSVCQLTAGGEILLASGSHDRTLRLWDPLTGQARRHSASANAERSVQGGH